MSRCSKNILTIFFILSLYPIASISAQVQVSKEPLHRVVIENQYIRLLDVWIEPGDSTQYHIHSTPSVFVYMSPNAIKTQIKGEAWKQETTTSGNVVFKSFSPDKVVHRVCNIDTSFMHVIDIELLSMYDKVKDIPDVPQPYPVIMDNEKAYAYRMNSALLKDLHMVTPGPVIAILVSGGPVTLFNEMMAESNEIAKGQYAFFDTGTFLSFAFDPKSDPDLLLIELK